MTRRDRSSAVLLCASVALALLAAGCKAPPRKPTRSRPIDAAPRKARPAEEIRTVLLPSPEVPIVSVRLTFLSGSVDDPKGKEGLTALTAALMVKGGTLALTAASLLERLFPMAAYLDVRVEKEMTTFVARVHRDHWPRFEPILVDVLLRPRWDAKEFARLRTEALNDVRKHLRTGDDELLGKEALQGLLYRGHPYGHYAGGTVRGLTRLTVEELKAHAQRVFTRARLVLGLGGAVDAALADRLGSALVALPAASQARTPLPPPPSHPVRVLLVEKECRSTAISLGHPHGLKRVDPDFFPAFVGNSAFGEHRQFGGRLFEALRGQRGLNYGDYSYLEHFVQDGYGTYPAPSVARRQQYFSIWLRPVEHPHRVFALRAALHELGKLLASGLTDDEVTRTRGFLKGYTRMWEQTVGRRLGFAIDDLYYESAPTLEGLRRSLPRLNARQINEALRRHLRPEQLRIVMVTKGAQALRKELLSGEASPIVYPSPKPAAVLAEDKEIARHPLRLRPEEVEVRAVDELFEE